MRKKQNEIKSNFVLELVNILMIFSAEKKWDDMSRALWQLKQVSLQISNATLDEMSNLFLGEDEILAE